MRFLNDIVVLSHDTIAVVNPVDNTLELCRLNTATATLHILQALDLPPIHNDLSLFRVSTAHGASTDSPRDSAPPSHLRSSSSFSPAALFYEDPARVITCIALHYTTKRANPNNEEWIAPEERARVLLVTRRTALRALAATSAAAEHAPVPTPWRTWSLGAAVGARALRLAGFGAHAALHERLFVCASGAVTHLDFNPHRVRASGVESLCYWKRGAWAGDSDDEREIVSAGGRDAGTGAASR